MTLLFSKSCGHDSFSSFVLRIFKISILRSKSIFILAVLLTFGLSAKAQNSQISADDFANNNASEIKFFTSGQLRSEIKSDGNFHIYRPLTANSDLIAASNAYFNHDTYMKGHIWLWPYEGKNVSGTAYIQARANASTSINLQFRTQQNGNLIDALRITSGGSVGIGTTNPQSKLDVNGTITANKFQGDGSLLTNLPVGSGSNWTKSGSNLSYTLGNVGIGTSSPSERLHVNGKLRVDATIDAESNGIEFRHANRTQGIGFGFNTIYATGSNTNQSLKLKSRGTGDLIFDVQNGKVVIKGASLLGQSLVSLNSELPTALSRSMVISARLGNTINDHITGFPGSSLTFAVDNGTYKWNVGTIMGVADPLNTTNYSGGLAFFVKKPNLNANEVLSMVLGLGKIYFNGDVGVGNSTPSERLHVNGNLKVDGKYIVQGGTDGGPNKGIFMWNGGDSNWGIYMGQAGSGKSLGGGTAPAGYGFSSHAIRFRVNDGSGKGFIWENSSNENLMSLRGSDGMLYVKGNVSIGNTDPNNQKGKLHVVGSLHVENTEGKQTFHVSAGKQLVFVGDSAYIQYQKAKNDNNSSDDPIDQNNYSLWVSKGIVTQDLAIVSPSYWADHVFSADYRLAPLSEVESFIKANGHLPNIPSQKEVTEKGYTLQTINAKFLEKIEELTLYTIEQDKKVRELEDRLAQMQAALEKLSK